MQGSFFDAEGRAGAERGVATTNVLNLTKGYVRDGGAWDSDVRTPTRLDDDPQVTLRLGRVRDGRIEPYAPGEATDEPWRPWRLSEVNIAARHVGGEAVPTEHVEAARAAKADWTRFDAEKILVVLDKAATAGTSLSGSAAAAGEAPNEVLLSYDPQGGLTWKRSKA